MISKSKVMLLGLAAAVSVAAHTNAWELGRPDAKLLMGIDLKSLRESAVGQSIREQMKTQPASTGVQAPFQVPFQAMALGLLEQLTGCFCLRPQMYQPARRTILRSCWWWKEDSR